MAEIRRALQATAAGGGATAPLKECVGATKEEAGASSADDDEEEGEDSTSRSHGFMRWRPTLEIPQLKTTRQVHKREPEIAEKEKGLAKQVSNGHPQAPPDSHLEPVCSFSWHPETRNSRPRLPAS